MSGQLVDQLLEAGLVTEAQARVSEPPDPLVSTSVVIQGLVAQGLDELTLAGFFVNKGFGPMLRAPELARADEALVRLVSATDAHDLCAMPLRPSAAGAVVAMADPTDRVAVERLSAALGGPILPTVAKLSDLLCAIDRTYPPDGPTIVSNPVAAARPRAPSGLVPRVQENGEDTAQTIDDLEPPRSAFASTASPDWDRAWSRSATERDVSLTPKSTSVPLPTVVSTPPSANASLPTPPASHAVFPRPSTLRPAPDLDSLIEARLAELQRVDTRDDAVRVACEACATVSRGAAFLALRKGVFRGWDGAGEDVTTAGIRSLWVPASNPSVLNEVLHTGKTFRGAYGRTAADHLFRAAFGNHGREVVIAPVLIGARMVGVLCANDPSADPSPIERTAHALGEAFERLIVLQKSGN
jgi:hypothetical protein